VIARVRVGAVILPVREVVYDLFVAVGIGGKCRTVKTKVGGSCVVVFAVPVVVVDVAAVPFVAVGATASVVVAVAVDVGAVVFTVIVVVAMDVVDCG
jgi:hypothetical protein